MKSELYKVLEKTIKLVEIHDMLDQDSDMGSVHAQQNTFKCSVTTAAAMLLLQKCLMIEMTNNLDVVARGGNLYGVLDDDCDPDNPVKMLAIISADFNGVNVGSF